jgi:drug/metabolite transporter (DMT)-like permease
MTHPAPPLKIVAKQPSKLAGRLLALGAALLWSTSGLFAKATIFDDWPVEQRGVLLAFWRAAFAAAVLAPVVRRPRFRRSLVPLVACFAGMNITYLTAMVLTTAANAIWLQSTAPWWVFGFSVLWIGEPIVRRDLVPLGFGVLGVGTILFFEVQAEAVGGVTCGLASGACYAGVVLLMRRLRDENPGWIVTLSHAATALVLLPWIVTIDVWPSPTQLAVLALFGTVQMAVPYMLMFRGLRAITGVEATGIGLAEPVLTPLWVLLVWGEQPAPWTLAGAALILAGLLLRYVVLEVRGKGRRPILRQ